MVETKGEQIGFGTFKGVYTPSLLTILGVIMYLRFGWVLGNVGLSQTLLIVVLATSITFLTALSIAATATNIRVGGGGAYFMISRSLGLEPGAAIGLPLFFSQALVISFYITGFAESVNTLFPMLPLKLVGIATLVILTALAFLSADLALKAQYFILALIGISLVSLFAGGVPEGGLEPVGAVPEKSPFWVVFAVFFPAVTGIEAGIALSGDLKNPSRALPLGTLAAVVTGFAVYLVIPIFLSHLVSEEVLLTDPLLMRKIAWWGDAIILGVWGATLSSALSSLLGAPRTLRALARDGVVPRFLARGSGSSDAPRIATAVAFLIALVGLVAGDLNVIAPILSMFFLTSYGVLNFSAGIEGLIASPFWRPTFRTPWGLSLLGAFGCVATMFMINAGATFVAAFFCVAVFYLMQRRQLQAHWGDTRYGILMLLARYAVYRLAESRPEAKTWRPNILVLSGSPTSRWYLIELADAMTHGRGFLSVAAVVPEGSAASQKPQKTASAISEYLRKRGVTALAEVHVCNDPVAGLENLIATYGIGPLVPNTILLGESEKKDHLLGFARLIRITHRAQQNLVMVREGNGKPAPARKRRIDVWWGLQKQNVGLMLALAYLMTLSPGWRRAELTIRTVVFSAEEKEGALRRLQQFVTRGRLETKPEVVVSVRGKDIFETIRESSQGADLVLLGIRPPLVGEGTDEYGGYYQNLLVRTSGFPPTALVLACEDVDFSRIFG